MLFPSLKPKWVSSTASTSFPNGIGTIIALAQRHGRMAKVPSLCHPNAASKVSKRWLALWDLRNLESATFSLYFSSLAILTGNFVSSAKNAYSRWGEVYIVLDMGGGRSVVSMFKMLLVNHDVPLRILIIG
ncbi:hypothetical protein Tco_0566983 [Tanacetum coccineum]